MKSIEGSAPLMRVLVVGGGAREHAIAAALAAAEAEVVVASTNQNPGIERIARSSHRISMSDPEAAAKVGQSEHVDLAVIGPEAPLAAGFGNALRSAGVPVVGPDKDGARIETSKLFCRELLAKYRIDIQPKFVPVLHMGEVGPRVAEFNGPFVIKPVGLNQGKGVAVMGSDFATPAEGASYVRQLLALRVGGGAGVLLEEKLEGEEFSLMAFVTDSGVYPMPLVQDYKRAEEGNQGPNTGGMGSYSQRDHLLPFLSHSARDAALAAMVRVVAALRTEGISYRGILYGGFMLTRDGPKLLEFNARFGDPEALNVLSLYEEGNFAELLAGVASGHLNPTLVSFRLRASVTKYLVPPGYPNASRAGGILWVDEAVVGAHGVRAYYGSVDGAGPGRVRLSASRGVALVGEASAIFEASARVEAALDGVRGEYALRRDIGTREDLTRRVEHMRRLLAPGGPSSPLPLSVAPADAPPSSAATADQIR
jgi:phosphoribosylamine---glycine ligase